MLCNCAGGRIVLPLRLTTLILPQQLVMGCLFSLYFSLFSLYPPEIPCAMCVQDMAALLESGVAADVTFKVEDEEMKVHRIILQVIPQNPPSSSKIQPQATATQNLNSSTMFRMLNHALVMRRLVHQCSRHFWTPPCGRARRAWSISRMCGHPSSARCCTSSSQTHSLR